MPKHEVEAAITPGAASAGSAGPAFATVSVSDADGRPVAFVEEGEFRWQEGEYLVGVIVDDATGNGQTLGLLRVGADRLAGTAA